jgi:hypothetical protein
VILCSLVIICQCFGGTYCLPFQGRRVSHLQQSVCLKAVCSSRVVVNYNENMWCQIPEDSNLHSHWHENIKPHAFPFVP